MAGFEISEVPYLIIGAFAEVRERSEKVAKGLVDKGKGLAPAAKARAAEGKKAGEALKAKGKQRTDELTEAIGDTVEKVIGQMGLVTKSDVQALDKKVASLEKKVDKKAAEAKKAKAAEAKK